MDTIALKSAVKAAPARHAKVLVTGGSGFIGQHLVAELRRRDDFVRVLDLQPPRTQTPSEFIDGTILDAACVRRALDGVDTVYHLAAIPHFWTRDRDDFARVNHLGTEQMLALAREAGVETFVHCSTEAILFPRAGGEAPERADDMPGPYTRSKFLAEQAAFAAARNCSEAQDGMRVVIASPTIPIGPGDHNVTEPTAMLSMFVHNPPPLVLDASLNLVDVRDVARGIMLAAERGRSGERYILGAENIRVRELARRVGQLCGRTRRMRALPASVALAIGMAAEWFANHVSGQRPRVSAEAVRVALRSIPLDTRKAHYELGYQPRAIDAALAAAIAWLTRHEAVRRPVGARLRA